jgi:hypothetical protein
MALLPDGRVLITEKPGRLRIFANGKLSAPIENVPKVAYRAAPNEQGGLLDVAIDPGFEQTGVIYLSYSEEAQPAPEPDPGDPRFGKSPSTPDSRVMGGAVMRATLKGNRLNDGKVIWRQEPKTVARGHFGHRLVFGRGNAARVQGAATNLDPGHLPLGRPVLRRRSLPLEGRFAARRSVVEGADSTHAGRREGEDRGADRHPAAGA